MTTARLGRSVDLLGVGELFGGIQWAGSEGHSCVVWRRSAVWRFRVGKTTVIK